MALERGKLIDDHHIVVKRNTALIDKPVHIFTIDDMDVGALHQCFDSFFFCSDRHAVIESLKVIPFCHLGRPCISRHSQRGYDQYLSYLKGIQDEIIQCG